AVAEPDLDPVGVEGRVRQDLGNDAPGALAGPLVALEHDIHRHPGMDGGSLLSVHSSSVPDPFELWATVFICGKRRTSLIESLPVISITSRSVPRPTPPVGGIP